MPRRRVRIEAVCVGMSNPCPNRINLFKSTASVIQDLHLTSELPVGYSPHAPTIPRRNRCSNAASLRTFEPNGRSCFWTMQQSWPQRRGASDNQESGRRRRRSKLLNEKTEHYVCVKTYQSTYDNVGRCNWPSNETYVLRPTLTRPSLATAFYTIPQMAEKFSLRSTTRFAYFKSDSS